MKEIDLFRQFSWPFTSGPYTVGIRYNFPSSSYHKSGVDVLTTLKNHADNVEIRSRHTSRRTQQFSIYRT